MMRFVWLFLWLCPTVAAQFDGPYENLQVLPKDIKKEDLRAIMRGWSGDLGVRCVDCHYSASGKFEDIDFASDQNDAKKTARAMVKMTAEINERFFKPQNLEISCYTCHHGTNKPVRLEQILAADYAQGGVDLVEKTYRDKHNNYYGAGAYNFRAWSALNALASELMPTENWADIKRIHEINIEFNPDYDGSHFFLGVYYLDQELVPEKARSHLNVAMKINTHWTPRKAARLAHRFKRRDKAALARRLLETLTQVAPDNADVHSNLGDFLSETGETDAARTAYESALARDANHQRAKAGLAKLP